MPIVDRYKNHSCSGGEFKIIRLEIGEFCCYIFVSLFGVKILNIILCMSRCGVYVCVRRWAICVRPCGV